MAAEHLMIRKIWYDPHRSLRSRVESGKVHIVTEEFYFQQGYCADKIVDGIWAGALEAAARVEQEFGPDNLGPWTDFGWGMLNGKLSALRWVTGDGWDNLGT